MGGKYGTGCTYKVAVTAIWGNPTAVIFEDFTENRVLGTSSIVDSKASASWKPQRTGKHLIVARRCRGQRGVDGGHRGRQGRGPAERVPGVLTRPLIPA